MDSAEDTARAVGCPIRRPWDHRSLASPPGFSQRATSFIASQCQGIHQMPFSSLHTAPNNKNPGSRSQISEVRYRKLGGAYRRTRQPFLQKTLPADKRNPAHQPQPPKGHGLMSAPQASAASVTYNSSLHPLNQQTRETLQSAVANDVFSPSSDRRPIPPSPSDYLEWWR